MKGVSMLKTINKKLAAESTTSFLTKEFGSSAIEPAEMTFTGRSRVPKEPGDSAKGLIAFMDGGKVKAFYVDKYIAKSFQKDPPQAKLISTVLQFTNTIWRSLFINLNPGFIAFNAIRDFQRAVKNLPTPGPNALKAPTAFVQMARYYFKNLKPALRRGFGINDDLINEMLERKVLITVESKWGLNDEDTQMEALMKRFSEQTPNAHSPLVAPFVKLGHLIMNVGQTIEALPKVAGYQYLKAHQAELGLDDKQIDHMIRGQIGSPDFLRQGAAYSLYNNIFLFSNSIKEGIRSDLEVMKERPAEYWWKTAEMTILPKMLMYAASIGLMGAGVKKIMDRTSSYDKLNYLVVPLGMDANGKGVVFRLPIDETGRFVSGMLWMALNVPQMKVQNTAALFDYMAGQAPTLTPTIGIVADVLQYMSGKNPYDWFRGQTAIPDNVFQAHDWHTTREFLKYLANQGGASLIYRFPTGEVDRVKSDLEKAVNAPIVGNMLGRFIKVSNYGLFEQLKQVSQLAAQEAARVKLNDRDAMADNINATNKPGIASGLKLYAEMLKDGELRRGLKMVKPREFLSNYQRMADQKTGDPYINAVVFSQSMEEKSALIGYYKQTLPPDQFKDIIGRLMVYDHLGPEAFINAEIQARTEKKK
jgi:hypothetical protein